MIIECHLIPNLGSIPLTQLRPQHLQRYYADKLMQGRRDGKGGLFVSKWSQRSDSNRGPAVYETAALPLSYAGSTWSSIR